MPSRREALRTIAAGAMAPALGAQPSPAQPSPKHLDAEDYKTLQQVVDLIIPPTDTPGASAAGVPMYIDRAIGKKPEIGAQLLQGLAKLRGLGSQGQMELLRQMEASGDPFFQLIKDLTIDGYYSSKEGLVQELGFHGNTFVAEFKGCTHPEHQIR